MIVHQLVEHKSNGEVVARCGYVLFQRTTKTSLLEQGFTGFDSRVTCENCKPIKQEPGQPRRVRIKSKSRVLGRNQ